jgi:glycosidase
MTSQEHIFGPLSTPETRVEFVKEFHQGVKHGYRLEPQAPAADDSPMITVYCGLNRAIERVICQIIEPDTSTVELQHHATEWDVINWQYYEIWQGRLPARQSGSIVRYHILAWPADGGKSIPADDGQVYSYYIGNPKPPAWSEAAIIYQIFPDRFHPGKGKEWKNPDSLEGYFGGTLRGIIDNFDHIIGLGFNCIWLNPFFPDHTYHGYHATDYFEVNPRLGNKDDLHELVEMAKVYDVRLILDFVANHWGSRHPTFQAAQANRSNPHYDWYRWSNWPEDYETFFKVKDLPQINLDHPPARSHIIEAAQYWLREFEFDGLRLDYALGPSLDFWTDFRVAVQQVKPDVWIFGEVVDMPSTQLNYWGRLHGCLDFLLQEALRKTFALDTMKLTEFEALLSKHEAYFPAGYSRPSFLDNHDVDRFLWLVNNDKRRLKLAALCQFTLSGPPIVYYGTEVGLSQDRDMMAADGSHQMAEARLPMVWGEDQDKDLYDFYSWLISLRRQHPVLWRGTRHMIHLDDNNKTYAYIREDDREAIIIAFNLSDQEQKLNLAEATFQLPALSGDVQIITGAR